MAEKIRELSDIELENINGGGHLSSREVKDLAAGQVLVIEDCLFDTDLAKGVYTGNWRDPGPLSMLEVEVEILEVYVDFTSHGIAAERGKKLYISRWCVDYYKE